MRKRLLGLSLLGGLVVLSVACGYWLTRPTPRVTEESFAEIQPGMTIEQVEAIIGGPPGNYSGRPAQGAYPLGCVPMEWDHCQFGPGPSGVEWVGPDMAIAVRY